MKGKKFIAKLLLLTILVQVWLQPVLTYAERQNILSEENVIEEGKKEFVDIKSTEDDMDEIIALGPKATATLKGNTIILNGKIVGPDENEDYGNTFTRYDQIKYNVEKIIIDEYFNFGQSSTSLFNNFDNLISIENLDLIDTSEMEIMIGMFSRNLKLKKIDISSFDTSKVDNMEYMFEGCTDLEEVNMKGLDFSSVRGFYSVFENCESLKEIDLSGIIGPNIEAMNNLFTGCKSLKKVNLKDFNAEKLEYIEEIFLGCTSLEEIDLSSFNAPLIYDMRGLFQDCPNLKKVNIKNFNMILNDERDYLDTENMFKNSPNIEELVLGENVRFYENPTLEENTNFPYTGKWKVKEYPEIIYENSQELIDNYTGEYPGVYYREKLDFTISFNSNGGSQINPVKVFGNDTLSIPKNPTREGYDFVGWYTDKALTKEYDFNSLIKNSFTLYAKWKVKETPVERLSDTVVLASGYKYTDVLTATVLANEKQAPILLSEADTLTDDTMTEIKRINPTEIIISGGEKSVSKKVEDLLKAELKDTSVTRISGSDRYETAKNIGVKVREISPNKTQAMLVDGTNFPDVITMSTIASERRAPILLTEPSVLNETTKNILNEFNIKDIIIGGGFDSVSENIEKVLRTSNNITRYGGSDRYETASIVGNVYRTMAGVSNNLIIVDGTNFPDGITTSSLASKIKAPILLTKPNNLPEITAEDINTWKATSTIIAGGENSVSENIYNKVNGSERISGKDRYETAVKISQKYLEDK